MSDAIRINGAMTSWSSTSLKIAGEPFYGITSISYGDKRTRSKAYGMGRHHAPRGRSAGKYETDNVKIKGPKATIQAIRDFYASKAEDGASYGTPELDWILQFVEGDEQQTIELEKLCFAEDTSSNEEGADALQEEVGFDCMSIRRNGLTLFDNSDGQR